MKRTLNFQEKLLIFIKRTKYKNLRYSAVVLPILVIFLVASTWIGRTDEVKDIEPRKDQKLTMTMVGDVMMGRHVEEVTKRHGADYLFRHVKPYFDASDYVSGNFEHPILKDDVNKYEKAEKSIHLRTDMDAIHAVKNAGFTVMNLANNHLMDYGEEGLRDTLDVFDRYNMEYVGGGENRKEAKEHINYQDVNGVRVATLGFTDAFVEGTIATKDRNGLLSANPDVLFDMIEKAKNEDHGNADLVVVNVHWGQEYDTEATPRQKALAKAMVDAGADIIIGHHPHVLQSFDVYKDGIIFYSLGNFVFDQGWTRTKDSAMVQYNLTEDGTASIDVIPLQIEEAAPRLATGYFDQLRVFNQLTKETAENVYWSKKDNKIEIIANHKHVIDRMKKRQEKEN
ncbi:MULTISPECIES: CapA family protein [unclassified Cytobacillus]|uniref:CapA family protein n=1 Tax=unclassified Cytobacillus TaxID=2675268 RepID=UPI0013568152|nr:CapA family protein [Cytobacillus sp. AMY 15.2]KAF0819668.1 Poly-gamma-glutamate synthase subunit PgsA/CapA [Bacillus sp. ZZV12-4809]MCM3090726.1 CapA family protein [Cytobacillus sp. AMY 15.2]